ncbi:efflux RND transporter periplasmic adaptor subunit [Xylophilus sp. GOD-11R]|uniref:efflux RND transporter periplasmic adaptor subunit n=1 Tax=Xylophilus sp. GOD-11R TaxID=3089814 RepID=UPI00298D3645|nr:efflux RND transporter periplasmic adaptor subunit [Xylophilus sp. GOD-11R]WPB56213.1 efflux RND transporter periplasmic adaptor subunit [Xylophilus sp. GOD-11R]
MDHPRFFTRTVLAVCLVAALAACGKKEEAAQAAPETPPDPMLVTVQPAMAGNFKVGKLATAEISPVQEITGRIDASEHRVTRIGSAVTGRVTEVMVEIGDTVRAGQALARVASPELTQAQLAVLRANAASSLASRAVDRARQLLQADVIGSAELQRRESELSVANAELRASTEQLQLLGMSNGDIQSLRTKGTLAAATLVVSPRAGVVIERNVSQGQVAQPGDPLFTVADLQKVWVIGAVPEQAASSVEVGQSMEISVPALGGDPLTGKVVVVGATVQPDTRTVAVRTEVDNPKRALKPQMLATMRISGAASKVLAVPPSSVVRDNDRDNVFVKTGENKYRLTPVELGPNSGGMRPMLQGPREGTEIVTEGAFHLNNERKRAELE